MILIHFDRMTYDVCEYYQANNPSHLRWTVWNRNSVRYNTMDYQEYQHHNPIVSKFNHLANFVPPEALKGYKLLKLRFNKGVTKYDAPVFLT